jgi:hypothetical protein
MSTVAKDGEAEKVEYRLEVRLDVSWIALAVLLPRKTARDAQKEPLLGVQNQEIFAPLRQEVGSLVLEDFEGGWIKE